MSSSTDGMGPRIDLGPDPQEPDFSQSAPPNPYQPPRRQAPGLATYLSGGSLLVALMALVTGIWAMNSEPQTAQATAASADVIPGGAAVRVAQLEKDVQGLMLRTVTLERELAAVAGKTGGVTKITELTAKVAALQSRLDAMGGAPKAAANPPSDDSPKAPPKAAPAPARPESSAAPARPEASHRAEAPRPAPAPAPAVSKPSAKAESDTARKIKHVYNVRRGDTLFSVARRYNVTPEDLTRWNKLEPGAHLLVDQQLVIYK